MKNEETKMVGSGGAQKRKFWRDFPVALSLTISWEDPGRARKSKP